MIVISEKWAVCFSKIYLILFLCGGFIHAQENWVYPYDEFGNDSDGATSIVYGLDGNIYAAGYSTGAGTGADFTVISLTTVGDTNWVYRYNGPGNNDDGATSLVYGSDDNIYAAGYSAGDGTGADLTVISLTTVGDANWVYRYNGMNSDDVAQSIVYGLDGNIYAAGYSCRENDYFYDFIVICLTPAGVTNWVYRNNPMDRNAFKDIAYGSDGNIYAAGETGWGHFTVISLDTAGSERWVYTYSGPGWQSAKAYSLVYGLDGNIYVGGYVGGSGGNSAFTVVSLKTTGDTRWIFQYEYAPAASGNALSVTYGIDGNIYAAGYANLLTIIRLTVEGCVDWIYNKYGTGRVNSIINGLDGNLYAAAQLGSGGGETDFIVSCLTTAGYENWFYRYEGPGNDDDVATSIVYGTDGNIYAAGYSIGADTSNYFTVISLTTAGATNWVYLYRYVEENNDSSDNQYELYQNLPNPFVGHSGTTIGYSLCHTVDINLSIYNSLGQCIRTLVNDTQDVGVHTVRWYGRNDLSERVAAGIYFCRLNAGEFSGTKKLLLLR